MTLILLEGMDKTAKSTVAQHFHLKEGYNYVHMKAPRSGTSRQDYLAEMASIIAETSNKKVIIDRTWYGELVWPYAYSRTPLLYQSDIQLLDKLACEIHCAQVMKVYMYDPDEEAHKARLRAFNEPTYDYRLVKELYNSSMTVNGFKFYTFQQAEALGWISKNA